MVVLIADQAYEAALRRQRLESGADRFDEVWERTYVITGLGDNDQRFITTRLCSILQTVVGWPGLGKVFAGVNVSDRKSGWTANYRIPDVAVFLNGTQARNEGTHWLGGPDFAVEITSPGDLTREKMPFYAEVGTRELLILDRESWTLELYALDAAGKFVLVGASHSENDEVLSSRVVPLGFQLQAGEPRPVLVVGQAGGEQRWRL